MNEVHIIEWLFSKSNPILRFRTGIDLMGVSISERNHLFGEAYSTAEVQRWLHNLAVSENVHGSRDTDAENALAKLVEYGFSKEIPEFDQSVRRILDRALKKWDSLALFPYLIRGGYANTPMIRDWFEERIDKLYQTAIQGRYDLYLDEQEAAKVPKAWRGKPIYRDQFGDSAGYALPTCFDFYAMAYHPDRSLNKTLDEKCERIVAYLSDARFQETAGGYGWDKPARRCYAAGRVFLACMEPCRQVLFLELGSKFHAAIQSTWFQTGLNGLESYRTETGSFRLPPELLLERTGNHLYGGSHMGLGENRQSPMSMELESTFRMLLIRKNVFKMSVNGKESER